MNLQWCAATRHHDWLADDRAVARRLLSKVEAAGLVLRLTELFRSALVRL